jgi:hypothetical protein
VGEPISEDPVPWTAERRVEVRTVQRKVDIQTAIHLNADETFTGFELRGVALSEPPSPALLGLAQAVAGQPGE